MDDYQRVPVICSWAVPLTETRPHVPHSVEAVHFSVAEGWKGRWDSICGLVDHWPLQETHVLRLVGPVGPEGACLKCQSEIQRKEICHDFTRSEL